MQDFLIISAARFEVEPLLKMLDANRVPFTYAATGIGALAAAANAAKLGQLAADKNVIFIGTAGTFGAFDQPFLCAPKRVAWLPACERLGLAYGVPRGQIPLLSVEKKSLISAELQSLDVICGPSISLQGGFAEHLASVFVPEQTAENLELFSCLEQIQKAAMTVDVMLGITNCIGENAHAQWKQWHAVAAEMSARHVMSVMSKINPKTVRG